MEFSILYWIQNLHSHFLDTAMVTVFSDLIGPKGEFWLILGVILLIIPKTRKTGICVVLAYGISYLLGDFILKDLIARPRPCMIDETVELIIKRPTSFSCPSVHTMFAFASAAAIFHFHKKTGAAVLVFAALVGFSRMYFFVHFPTDVLFGAILGFVIGTAVAAVAGKIKFPKKSKTAA